VIAGCHSAGHGDGDLLSYFPRLVRAGIDPGIRLDIVWHGSICLTVFAVAAIYHHVWLKDKVLASMLP